MCGSFQQVNTRSVDELPHVLFNFNGNNLNASLKDEHCSLCPVWIPPPPNVILCGETLERGGKNDTAQFCFFRIRSGIEF